MPYFKAAFSLKVRALGQAQMLKEFASTLSIVDQDYMAQAQALQQAGSPLFLELKESWRKAYSVLQAIQLYKSKIRDEADFEQKMESYK